MSITETVNDALCYKGKAPVNFKIFHEQSVQIFKTFVSHLQKKLHVQCKCIIFCLSQI